MITMMIMPSREGSLLEVLGLFRALTDEMMVHDIHVKITTTACASRAGRRMASWANTWLPASTSIAIGISFLRFKGRKYG